MLNKEFNHTVIHKKDLYQIHSEEQIQQKFSELQVNIDRDKLDKNNLKVEKVESKNAENKLEQLFLERDMYLRELEEKKKFKAQERNKRVEDMLEEKKKKELEQKQEYK